MEFAHKDLEKKRFEVPNDIKKVTVCKDSGMLPGEYCDLDPRGKRTYTEVYVNGTQPREKCSVHVQAKVCEEGGTVKLANEYCTTATNKVFITRKDSNKEENWKKATDAQYMLPTEKCTTHTKPEEKPVNNIVNNAINNIINNTVSNKVTNTSGNTVNNTVNNTVTNTTTNTNTNTNTITNTIDKPNSNTVTNTTTSGNTVINNVLNNVVNKITNNE